MTTQANPSFTQLPRKRIMSHLIRVVPLAILVAGATNLGLYAAAGALHPPVTAWVGAGPSQIIVATVTYLLIAAIAFYVTVRRSANSVRTYLLVATVGLGLSLAPPIAAGYGYGPPGAPPADLATVVTLCLMHILSYLISVPLYVRSNPE